MHIVQRRINRKQYFFIEKSVRLPDGGVRKLSRFCGVKKPRLDDETLKGAFLEKEKQLFGAWAVRKLRFAYPLTIQDMHAVEGIRIVYRHLLKEIPKQRMKDLLDRFTVNFTYESNALEGNSLTLKDVSIVIVENENVPGKTLREIYETRNHRKVMELLFARKIKVTHASFIKVHKLLMRDIDEESSYKRLPNFIVGSRLRTSPPERVFDDMSSLIQWYSQQSGVMHSLQLATLFHGKFLQIHPFADGNGRIARVFFNAMLVNEGYPPVIVRKTQRIAYLNALRAYDRRAHHKLVRFFLERYKRTFEKFFGVYVQYLGA